MLRYGICRTCERSIKAEVHSLDTRKCAVFSWNVGAEHATLVTAPGKIVFRFHSRDLHMVLGPSKNGTPVRFKVRLNGAGLGEDHGVDSTADGTGEVRQQRMYQLIRQKGQIKDVTFEIEFLDPGVEAFSFTFG